MTPHGVGYNDVYNNMRGVVDAVNLNPQLQFKFPASHSEQIVIASHFSQKSSIDFDNCAGFIDGLLIRTNKPTKPVLIEASLGAKIFLR